VGIKVTPPCGGPVKSADLVIFLYDYSTEKAGSGPLSKPNIELNWFPRGPYACNPDASSGWNARAERPLHIQHVKRSSYVDQNHIWMDSNLYINMDG